MNWTPNDEKWMRQALKMAHLAFDKDEVPVGAVLVSPSGQLLAQTYNLREKLQSPLGHAELMAIHMASKKLNNWRLTDCTLYVTLEPCVMCAGSLVQSRLKEIVYATHDPKGGALQSLYKIGEDPRLNHRLELRHGLFADEAQKLLKDFFQIKRRQKKEKN